MLYQLRSSSSSTAIFWCLQTLNHARHFVIGFLPSLPSVLFLSSIPFSLFSSLFPSLPSVLFLSSIPFSLFSLPFSLPFSLLFSPPFPSLCSLFPSPFPSLCSLFPSPFPSLCSLFPSLCSSIFYFLCSLVRLLSPCLILESMRQTEMTLGVTDTLSALNISNTD